MAKRANRLTLTLPPAVLRWARARARASLDQEDLAQRLKVATSLVEAWEQTGELEFIHAQRIAEKTITPVGYLFLPAPPQEGLPLSGFRTHDTKVPASPSPELLGTIYQCQRRQG